MPPSLIPGEMSPKGKLRPIFRKLARRDGCYVIVSVADDPTGSRLIERLDAMQTQLATIENQANLHLDFYGREDFLSGSAGIQAFSFGSTSDLEFRFMAGSPSVDGPMSRRR